MCTHVSKATAKRLEEKIQSQTFSFLLRWCFHLPVGTGSIPILDESSWTRQDGETGGNRDNEGEEKRDTQMVATEAFGQGCPGLTPT